MIYDLPLFVAFWLCVSCKRKKRNVDINSVHITNCMKRIAVCLWSMKTGTMWLTRDRKKQKYLSILSLFRPKYAIHLLGLIKRVHWTSNTNNAYKQC